MNLIGEKVTHKKYGEGVITGLEDGKIIITFCSDIRKFQYPEAFEMHLNILNEHAKEHVNRDCEALKEKEAKKQQEIVKYEQAIARIKKKKIGGNSQAVFDLDGKKLKEVFETWQVSVGHYKAGKAKGMPKTPKEINMNSACVLTLKEENESEQERTIAGIFMTIEEFVGENCEDGFIPAHENYRIIWDEDQEKLHFWNFFPERLRMEHWGRSEVKYMSSTFLKHILLEMEKNSSGDIQEKVKDFYQYFTQIND